VGRRAGVKHSTARSWCRRHRQRARRALTVETLCRVALVFDIGAYRDYAYLWARARVADLDRDLLNRGLHGVLVRIDIDGYPHLNP
jgi:hypothetical protein